MNLTTIFKFLVVLGLLYLAYAEGWPWLQQQLGGLESDLAETAGGEGEGGHCVARAARVADTLGDGIGRFSSPPHDLEAWDELTARIDSRANDAAAVCACSLDSCGRASQALEALRGVVGELDDAIRGGRPAFDAARKYERVEALLSEARGLVRQGR